MRLYKANTEGLKITNINHYQLTSTLYNPITQPIFQALFNMKSFTILALFLASVYAAPLDAHAKVVVVGNGNSRNSGDKNTNQNTQNDATSGLCPGSLGRIPQCCKTDVLGVADLDCLARKYSPKTRFDEHITK